MRPPKGLKDQHSISVNKSMPTPGSPSPVRGGGGENVIPEEPKKLTNDQKKENERQIDRYNRAWKRLRPNESPEQSPEKEDNDYEESKETSGLPNIPRRPVTQGQSNRPFTIPRAGNSLSKSARRVDPSSRGGDRGTHGVSTEAFTNKFR